MNLSLYPSAREALRDVPADASSLHNKAVELRHTINETLYINKLLDG